MNVEMAVNGRLWKVGVEQGDRPGRFTVVVKGRPRAVDAAWIDADTLSLLDRGVVHNVAVDRPANGAMRVGVDGRMFEVVPAESRKPGAARMSDSGGPASSVAVPASHVVKAPMPGRVVRVLVAVGDRVIPRQAVVIVEAMKMENELRASREGTVKEIGVRAGAAVETGAALVVIGD
jgi:biotin carboxyl carrier protein